MSNTTNAKIINQASALASCLMMLFSFGCATPHREPTKETLKQPRSSSPAMMSLSEMARNHHFLPSGENQAGRKVYRRGVTIVEVDPRSRVSYFDGKLVLMGRSPHRDGANLLVPKSLDQNFAALKVKPAAVRPRPTKRPEPKPIPSHVLGGKHFVIDAGHGGRDHGASRAGVMEKNVTLRVALEVAALLRRQGARVTLTRATDRKIELNRRARISNERHPDAFVSIHINSASNTLARGVEIYPARFRSRGQDADKLPRSNKLATALMRALRPITPGKDRGIKRSPGFRVLKLNNHPAVLVELGFVTHRGERRLLGSRAYQKRLAKALVAGIREFSRSI